MATPNPTIAANRYGISPLQIAISAGTALSETITTRSQSLVGIIVPAGWTTANITVLFSTDGVNFYPVYDWSGSEYVITAAAGNYIALDPWELVGAYAIQLRSGTKAAPVNQTSTSVLTVLVRELT